MRRFNVRELQALWNNWGPDMARELKLIAGEPQARYNAQYWISWVAFNSSRNQERDDTFVVLATAVIHR